MKLSIHRELYSIAATVKDIKAIRAYNLRNYRPIQAGRTDKKENQIFLIYKEIQSGAVAKSYMRKGFLINEEMRKYFPIYEEAVSHI